MKKEKFHELLTKPESMKTSDTAQLQQVIKDYPFFHNAHLLLLFGLSRQNSESFDEQLKQSALYLSSRAQLVNSIVNGWPGSYATEGAETENEAANKEIDDEKPNVIVFDANDNAAPVVSESTSKGEEFVSSISASNEVTFEESFTFSLEDSKPIETLDKKEEVPAEKTEAISDLLEFDISSGLEEESNDLIDQFLKVNPRIIPRLDLEDARGDMSVPGLIENDEIVTETLADIYEQQGHYQKAKEAYQKLILKFPEKSAYFASRIQELDKLIK